MRFVAVTKRYFDFVTYGAIKFTAILPVFFFNSDYNYMQNDQLIISFISEHGVSKVYLF